MRSELEKSKGTATVATTLAAYDKLIEALNDGHGEAGFYRQVSPTAASREAAEKCEVRMASEFTKLSLSRPIYERIKAIHAPADEPTKLYLTEPWALSSGPVSRWIDAGPGQGAGAWRRSVPKLTTEFEANIPKGQRTMTVTAGRARRRAAGLPRRPQARRRRQDHASRPTAPITCPCMTYANSSDVRQRFYREYQLRAYPANDAVLRDLINKRDELAKLVGRPNYATLNFEDRMLNTPDKVQALMDDMASAAKPAADRDYAKKLALLQQLQPGATKLEPWDNGYISRLVQKQSYGYDRQEARKYFAYDQVRDGILELTEDMFDVDIRPWKTATWDKLVESL